MPEISTNEFDDRLNSLECSQEIRDILTYLRETAEQAGTVSWRAHSTPGSGWGITGKLSGRLFCRFDPKPSVPHVCAFIRGAAERELEAAGTVHRRKSGGPWVDIRNMRDAKVLEPLIARAGAAAARGVSKRGA